MCYTPVERGFAHGIKEANQLREQVQRESLRQHPTRRAEGQESGDQRLRGVQGEEDQRAYQ